jgi:hypothetical protein
VGTVRLDEATMSWTRTDDGIVVLNLETSRYLSINLTGQVLWDRLLGGTEPEELVAALIDAFEISRDQARTDVDAFLGALRSNGLLQSGDTA